MPWKQVVAAVVSGLTVAALVALARWLWTRRRVPTVLSRSTHRDAYLTAILRLSGRPGLKRLDVLSPRLYASEGRGPVARIQEAWAAVNRRDDGEVRVVTGNNDETLRGGAQLVAKGVHVRVTSLRSDQLSYHLFRDGDAATAVINRPDPMRPGRRRDRPVRLDGDAPVGVFESHFDSLWKRDSRSLESALAERAMRVAGEHESPADVLRAVERSRAEFNLDDECYRRVLTHLAFMQSASVIFVVGLPGAGKSLVRQRLAERLDGMRLRTQQLTDYVFAYKNFIEERIKLGDESTDPGYTAAQGGAFEVTHEQVLRPALDALNRVVLGKEKSVVALVEFARSDILSALQVFGDVVKQSQVIYVEAPPELREARLKARAKPPDTVVAEEMVGVIVSDDHLLTPEAIAKLYQTDNIGQLREDRTWRDRIHTLSNKKTPEDVDDSLDAIIREIVTRHMSGHRHR